MGKLYLPAIMLMAMCQYSDRGIWCENGGHAGFRWQGETWFTRKSI